ncbi:MAG TPA: aspartate kinase [Longimicrobiaceae bacterium]|nr:aspartate kinase [Longimicrobiaceae bacterium]
MLIVQKYGGTSVGTPERIRAVARRVAATRARGHDVVVVVSAMGDATDDLLTLAQLVTGSETPARAHPRELDMLLTAGERISMALLAMAIREEGAEALSLTGSQAAIITDGTHTAARIREVRADRVRGALADGCIVIVAGFQGVSREREITTLGRGGSDTSAVALAAALEADRCEIFTDVDGVFTADPRRVPEARLVPRVSHAEMIELAAAGAQVMHPRAVEIGARYGVDIRVLSSFRDDGGDGEGRGTLITQERDRMEELALTGITSQRGHARVALRGLPGGMATSTEVLTRLAEAGVPVDMISEHAEPSGRVSLQVTVWQDALDRARGVVGGLAERLGGGDWEVRGDLSRVTLVGSGMTGVPGVYARAFRALLDAGVEVQAVSTSAISITLLVPSDCEDDALRALHRAFELERAADEARVAPAERG